MVQSGELGPETGQQGGTAYTTDVDRLFEHYGVLASRLGAAGVAPPTTMLGVTRPAIPDLMVELEGTAVA